MKLAFAAFRFVDDIIEKEKKEQQSYQPRSRFEDKNGKCMICGYDYDVWPRCDHPGCHDGR